MMRLAGNSRWIAPACFVLAAFGLWVLVQQVGNGASGRQGREIDRPLPEFTLPPIAGYHGDGFSSADLRRNRVSIVNLFASWCIPCLQEHRYVLQLSELNIAPVYGINLRDDPEQARRWLTDLGDGYTATGADRDGEVAARLGILGIPTTLVVDGDARVRYVHIGPLTEAALKDRLLPIIRTLSENGPGTES